ncbi:MAG: 3-dehydroquinate synthase [bacterium]
MGDEKSRDFLSVRLPGGGGYRVRIEWGSLSRLGAVLRDESIEGEIFLLSDRTVWALYAKQVEGALQDAGYELLERFLLNEGEESKSLENWRAVLDRLAAVEDGTRRRLVLLNLGGGVVGDLGGFAAAAYRRGIPFIQVPTTLLAQVDSSVGGKTGVNHPAGKNLIGAFRQPCLVIADLSTLKTLPVRQVRSGLVEVVKYGLVRDGALFHYLEEQTRPILSLEPDALAHVVTRSCAIKAEIVGQDEREERGVRTLLNFGHTFGHALETAVGYGRLTHGEAVGIGILCAARISTILGMLAPGRYERIEALLEAIAIEPRIHGVDPERVWEAMKRDKKFLHGRNRFVLLEDIGRARVVEDVDAGILEDALRMHLV